MTGRRAVYDPAEIAAALDRFDRDEADRGDLKLLTKYLLARLADVAPGHSVEVRIPPYAAIQAVPGGTHTRGTPRAVVETDAATWIRVATGRLPWADAVGSGAVRASGERTDLSAYLPLDPALE